MKAKLIISTMALAMLAVGAMAQDQGGPPPGPPPGGGFGGPGGRGGFGGPGGGQQGLQPADRLVMRSDVQTEIQLTSDQKDQIKKVQDDMRSKMQPPQPGEEVDRDAMRKQFEAMRKETSEAIDKILTSDQKKRVREIAIQLAGNRALSDESVQKDLGLSSDQVAKIKSINSQAREANQSIFEKMRNGDIDQQSARDSMSKNQKALDTMLGSVLTSDQQAKLKELGGKHFEATSRDNGPGGPGGFGGPGGPGGPGGGPGGPPPGDGGPGGPPPGDGGI